MKSQRGIDSYAYSSAIFKHMPIGVALFDVHDFRLLTLNPRFESFLEPAWQQGRAIGHSLTEWIPAWVPDTEVRYLLDILQQVKSEGVPHQTEERSVTNVEEGTTSYWSWTLEPVYDEIGELVQLLLTENEVTSYVLARQQAEQANRIVETERKRLEVTENIARSVREYLDIEKIGNATLDALCNHFTPSCACIYVADAEQRMLHLLQVRFIPNIEPPMPVISDVAYDSQWFIGQAYKHHQPFIREDLQAEARRERMEDNHPLVQAGVCGYICIPLWFHEYFEGALALTFNRPVRSNGYEVQTLVGCATHISAALAHARLHSIIEREQDRLHTILDQLPEGITLVEVDGSLSYMNCAAEHLLQVSPESQWNALHDRNPLARSVKDLEGQNLSSKDFLLLHALHGETITGREMVITRPDNSSIVLMTSCAPLYNKEQEIMGAVSVFQDITLRKNMEQQKNEFLSLASHELRTPITSIQGLAEILQMHIQSGKSLDSSRSHHAIKEVIGQSRQLTCLIDGMLDISRLENMQLELQIVSHDIMAMLKRVVESQSMTSKHHVIQHVLQGVQAHETLMGCFDEQRMTQVINNLINNAVKYSPVGSPVEVGLRRDATQPDSILLWVKDVGVGIPQSELNSIFERFYRGSSVDRSIGGLGVGLYLVREIVMRHNGRVWAESVEGEGSTFYVLLPLSPSAD